jgi:hypothetical protein
VVKATQTKASYNMSGDVSRRRSSMLSMCEPARDETSCADDTVNIDVMSTTCYWRPKQLTRVTVSAH